MLVWVVSEIESKESQKKISIYVVESGSLSVALSPEETAGGVAGSATSTVYTIMAIKLRVEAQHNIGGQLAWS